MRIVPFAALALGAVGALVAAAPGTALATPVVVVAAVPGAPSTASAAAAPIPGCDDPATPIGDLDGDGVPEVVVGMPGYPGGGAVDLRFTAGGGTVLTAATLGAWTRAAGDRFGAAVLVTELNGDRCADLVIGSPGHAGTGAVLVALGNPQGYRPAEVTMVPTPTRRTGVEFGAALTIGAAFDIRGAIPVLAVGMPGYPVNGRAAAGAVVGYPVPGGVLGAPVPVTQDSPGVAGVAEAGDRFGSVLAPGPSFDILVGDPLEDVGSLVDAGSVTSLALRDGRWSGRVWSESSPLVPGVCEAGDHFGAAVIGAGTPSDVNVAQVTIGVPGEDVGGRRDVGTVVTMVDSATEGSAALLHQDGSYQGFPVPGTGEAGDRFGTSLGFWRGPRSFELLVGVPGEDVGTVVDAGALADFVSGPTELPPLIELTEADVRGGHVEAGDRFAATLASGTAQRSSDPPGASGSRLVVGIPGEDVHSARDAGAVAFGDGGGALRAVTLSAGQRAGLEYGAVPGAPTWVP